MQFRGRGPPSSSSSYDEQIGLTFTQSFTSMEYNVTAVEQTDPTLGDGPAYLLSGVSDGGYWYQVGLSWNWAPGENPGTGFGMSYEVFDTSGNSIFPTGGQGGVLAFSGPVNAGDVVLLDLYFSNSSQSVVMLAEDTNTGAVASEVYPSMGATYFVGLPDSISDQNGFFTGLMTEWYHGEPYYANEAEVIYSNPSYKLTSAWMWIDEFNSNTFQGIFSANTSAPVSYSKPAKLQEFTFNGTTEYSDAYEFITGSLTNATRPTSSKVPLTLSFTVDGGGTGYSSPEFTYVSNGTSNTVQLNESPTVYQVDVGTEWNVTAQLTGSNSSERWETDQPTAALAISSLTMVFVYRNQYYVTFGFLVSGGGSGFSPPTIAYSSFGSSETTPADLGVWADAGSRYEYPSLLAGSKQNERWCANMDGYISSSRQIDATYYHQYQVEFDISFRNTQLFPGVPLSSTVAGRPYSATMVLGMNEEWLDSGSLYSVRQTLSLASGDRLMTNGTWTGTSSVNLVVSLTYVRQFYIGIMSNTSYGGSVSPASGWYDSGSKLSLDAVASPGWQFENWEGVGSDSASGSNTSLYLTVGPNTPASETALFYPGVTIYATGPMSVSYKDESVSGAIPGGATEVVYVPSSTLLNLATSSVAFWDSFQGWRGAINSSDASTSFTVDGPTTVTSTSGYNYAGIGVLSVVVLLVAIVGTFALRKRRLSQHDTREVAQSASGSTLSEASKQESVTQADDSRWWRTDSSIECCGKEITIRQLLEKTWS
jgi:hypothetical protein